MLNVLIDGVSQVVDALAAEVDGADGRHEQQDRRQLEGIEVGGEQADRDRLHAAEERQVRVVGLPVLDALDQRVHHAEQGEHEQDRERGLKTEPAAPELTRGAEERDHEQEQDHDRARVHDYLDREDELRAQQQEHHGEGEHHDHQAEHGADGLVEGDDADAAHDRHRREERSEEHTSELQSPVHIVCRLLLEKKKKKTLIIQQVKGWKEQVSIGAVFVDEKIMYLYELPLLHNVASVV